ncbi:hypothetical protein C8R43DRAFT_951944 [Mycena crocata]|nr:hypothetical protein C8R43DRAFT_951944 [Mycena crocata]
MSASTTSHTSNPSNRLTRQSRNRNRANHVPKFLGNAFNWLLLGLLIMQVYSYWCNFPKDRGAIKILVYSVFVFDLIQTAFGTHETWWFAIENWGNIPSLQSGPWTSVINPIMCGISGWFSPHSHLVLEEEPVTTHPGLPHCIASSLLEADLTQGNLIRLHPLFSFWLAGSFSTDILITGSMIWILQTAKSTTHVSDANNLLNRLMLNAIQTGAVTVVCAGIGMALFVNYTDKNYYFAFIYILGKLHSQHSETFGMRIQVSRRTEREHDGVKTTSPRKNSNSTRSTLKWQTTMDSNVEDSQKPCDYDLTGGSAPSAGIGEHTSV